ncbi:LacI family DNA-binding transcriptional regulator [Bacillus sp. PS06]|uniref:LacI family DNA-binding transcriptional regulator n=1 Tax=Bacillus sp. PS06 TaxID=2764176 RepID=UPI00178532EE|nr:LacI family DNA-binding transcriptional regulator [Bacillus sp. PS06]MBD8067664.1 LacI family DNA-binding transcriptional regulator [Bacillus sp. PS06]
MKLTIKDIAKMADVSISTVSRVINGSKPVNEEIRKRVLDVINQTNYRPNSLNNQLKNNHASLIGVIIPEYSNTVLTDFIDGINNISKLYGYDIIMSLTDGTVDSELHYFTLLKKMNISGLIFVGSPLASRHIEIVKKAKIPCVIAGQISPNQAIPSVHVDNITASYEAVTFLIQEGHKEIAMIKGLGEMAVGGHRLQGYKQAMKDAGLSIREEWIVESGFSIEDGMKAMKQIIDNKTLPTAVFCATDAMAIGAMHFLLDKGIDIPNDISIIGFDGSLMSQVVRPKLSTVEYSAREMGMTATRNLVKLIKGDNEGIAQHSNVTHHLAIRESTKRRK